MQDGAPPPEKKRPRRVTLADVAARAGTSTITVSRALRRPDMVSEQLRTRIADVVAELGYVPDPAARALASRRSNVIGVLIPSVTNNVFSDVLTGIYDTVGTTPYNIQLANTRYDPAIEEQLIRVFLSQRPAGIIVAGVDQSAASRALLADAGCPVVQIMETSDDPIDMLVGLSHRDGARAATEHLLAQGYRSPGFIGARMDPRSNRRREGFRAALAAAGLDPEAAEVTTREPSSVGLGKDLCDRLLDSAPGTDAVFCNNDDLALGVLFAAARRGLRLGTDLGVCGFNDLEVMSAAEPAITSVRTPRREMGAEALRMVVARLNGDAVTPAIRDTGFTVVARASTRRG